VGKRTAKANNRRAEGKFGGVVRWLKRDWTQREKVLTALASLVAIVVAGMPIWQWATSAAKVNAEPTSALSVKFDARGKAVMFSFAASLHNEGTRDERIGSVDAYLRVHDDKNRQLQFERRNITLKEASARALVIAKGTEKIVTCEVSSHLIREFAAVLTDVETRRQLEVVFKGRDGSYPMTFNFDLSKEAAAMLLANQLPTGLRFVEESWK
jgi:hypothetical protein